MVELSDPSCEEQERACDERVVRNDGGGEVFWFRRSSSELLELVTIIPVDVGVIGGNEEGSRDVMASIQIERCQN